MKTQFDFEELQLLAIYECVSREETIAYLEEAMEYMDPDFDEALMECFQSTIEKLEQITEREYQSLDLSSYLNDDAEDLEQLESPDTVPDREESVDE